MNYQETLNWMFAQLPMYQRQGKTAFKKDLTNILAASRHLDFPEKKFLSIHVAGTNGKGSTSHMIASILQEAGYKVGLYTSPHLKDFRERIRVNGQPISEQNVVYFIDSNRTFLEKQKLSFFEMTVAMAFDHFVKRSVDIAVVEVGLGGRLDSTNIITPEVSVITNIGLDHTQFLGETIEEIAFEKGGVIKPGVPVVVGEKQKETTPVFEKISGLNNTEIHYAEELVGKTYKTDLPGDYQKKNIKTAVLAVRILDQGNFKISEKEIENGLQNVVENTALKGRYQVLQSNPKVICDTAHNKEGLLFVLDQVQREVFDNLHIVLGVVNDKNLESIMPLFPKNAQYYFCKPDIPRGLDAQELMLAANEFGLTGNTFSTVIEAYQSAKKNAAKNDLIYVGGSTFVVAEMPI
ncbi:MAG: folylpolyglutamate synthase/dihydrofolate synthase family protein [Bacteroidota bacterium]